MAIGSFRMKHLAECTNSSPSHVPSILESLIRAFEARSMVTLVYGNENANEVAIEADAPKEPPSTSDPAFRLGTVGAGGSSTVNGDPSSSALPRIRISFVLFQVQHVITFRLSECPDNAKDPFLWTLLMDLYRALLHSNLALEHLRRERSPPPSAPTSSQARHTAIVYDRQGMPAAPPEPARSWRVVNNPKPQMARSEEIGRTRTATGGPPVRTGWAASLNASRSTLQRELLDARRRLAVFESVAGRPPTKDANPPADHQGDVVQPSSAPPPPRSGRGCDRAMIRIPKLDLVVPQQQEAQQEGSEPSSTKKAGKERRHGS